jgi:hypothetical protein
MLDIVAIFSFITLFPLCVLYVHGCEQLKGKRK